MFAAFLTIDDGNFDDLSDLLQYVQGVRCGDRMAFRLAASRRVEKIDFEFWHGSNSGRAL